MGEREGGRVKVWMCSIFSVVTVQKCSSYYTHFCCSHTKYVNRDFKGSL